MLVCFQRVRIELKSRTKPLKSCVGGTICFKTLKVAVREARGEWLSGCVVYGMRRGGLFLFLPQLTHLLEHTKSHTPDPSRINRQLPRRKRTRASVPAELPAAPGRRVLRPRHIGKTVNKDREQRPTQPRSRCVIGRCAIGAQRFKLGEMIPVNWDYYFCPSKIE